LEKTGKLRKWLKLTSKKKKAATSEGKKKESALLFLKGEKTIYVGKKPWEMKSTKGGGDERARFRSQKGGVSF